MSHTPGPWTLKQEDVWPFDLDIVGSHPIVNIRRIAHSSSQQTLADCRAAVGFPYKERDNVSAKIAEQEANARLIAAAPDLLAALRWYVENDEVEEMDGNEFWLKGREQARDAIKKATGE